MAIVQINDILKETVLSKLKGAQSGLFAADIKIYNSDNPDPKHVVKPLYMESYNIIQDFTKTYTDIILLTVNISVKEFFSIVKNNGKNLYCTIMTYPVNESTRLPVYNIRQEDINISQAGWIHTYRAIVLGLSDILKQYNINQLEQDEKTKTPTPYKHSQRMRLALQLISEDAYNVRTTSFALPLSNTTVKQAIYASANTLGVKNIYLHEPDNKQVYPSLIIPPMQTLESFIPMLQNYPGIYKEGIEYYYTNNTLYIYPGYKVDPLRNDPIVNFYKVPKDTFPGLFGYQHRDKDKNIHIVTDTDIEINDNAPTSLENIGNHVVTLDTEKSLDLTRTTDGKKGTFNFNNLFSIGLTNIEGNTPNKYKTTYIQGSSNPFQMASQMLKENKLEITLGWHNPLPFTINPGQRCIYHYEDEVGYKTKIGIIDSVSYTYDCNNRTSSYIYKGEAIAKLRLASDSEKLVNDGPKSDTGGSIFDIISNLSLDKITSLF